MRGSTKGGREAVLGEPTDPGPGRPDGNDAAPAQDAAPSARPLPSDEDDPDPDPGPSRPDRARRAARGRRTTGNQSSSPRSGARARSDLPLLARGAHNAAPRVRRPVDLLGRRSDRGLRVGRDDAPPRQASGIADPRPGGDRYARQYLRSRRVASRYEHPFRSLPRDTGTDGRALSERVCIVDAVDL